MSHAASPLESRDDRAANDSTDPARFRPLADRFRAVAAQHPDLLALRDADRSLTYAEADLATNGATREILALGHDGPVVVVAPLTIDSVLLLYGALKAGRMVVPLDPRWPTEQWLEVTRSIGGVLVVADDAVRATLPGHSRADAVVAADLLRAPAPDPGVVVDPEAPAFIFFTSGSTGTPKGTVLGHRTPDGSIQILDPRPGDRLALVAPLSFVTGALAALMVLVTGASGHLYDGMGAEPAQLARWLDDEGITLMGLSPTMVSMIARAALDEGRTIDSLRLIIHGGEVGTPALFATGRRAFPNARLNNAYGMTETGGPVCEADVDPDDASAAVVPVGRPMREIRIDVVDDDGVPVPEGETGEIWVSGRRVAFGYWDQPALTAERFLVGDDGVRTVRTGDRGRFRPDGQLEHLGRLDRQVKVHGQSVDLAQVEHEIGQLPHVRDAVVSSVPTDDGGHRVVAHVVLDDADGVQSVTVAALRRGLATRLPPYAIPRAFFRINDVPQMLTGKVDRVGLRESAVGALPLETDYVAPRNDREQEVARLFSEALAVPRVGVHDDFFELGGDSLSAVDLLAGLAEEFGLELSATDLIRHATVEAVAVRLAEQRTTLAEALVRVNDGTGRTLFCVPGAASTPLQFRPLGRRLADVAVYAFTYRGIEHRARPDLTVTAIARRNVAALRRVDPVGPYRLFGYSFGGAVALVMAQLLTASGADVELLALLEPTLWSSDAWQPKEQGDFERLRERALSTTPGRDPHARLAQVRMMGGAAKRYLGRQARTATAGVVVRRGLAQHEVFMRLHSWLMRTYRPRPYDGRTVLLASPRHLEPVRDSLDEVLPPESAGGRRIDVAVTGAHLDLVREPGVASVARALELVLRAEV